MPAQPQPAQPQSAQPQSAQPQSAQPRSAEAQSAEAQSAAATGAVALPARLIGALDMVRPDRIGGWALDRANRAATLEIEVFREGRRIASLRADRPRKDLARGADGSGNHGFAVALDPPLEPGFEFTVTALARAADGTTADLRRPATATADPGQRLLERLFEESVRPREDTATADLLQRLEITQARIEATLAGLEAPAPRPDTGLRLILAAALATGIGSLLLGLYSMLT